MEDSLTINLPTLSGAGARLVLEAAQKARLSGDLPLASPWSIWPAI